MGMQLMIRVTSFTVAGGLLFAALPASAQSTECNTFGAQTTCNTTGSATPPSQQYFPSIDQQNALNAAADRQAAAQHAAMFNQVGELIAKGDCDGAKRLTAFYADRGLTKATARACP